MASDENSLMGRGVQAFQRLSDRERRLVLLTAGVALVLLVVGVGALVGGALDARQKRVAQHRQDLAELEALRGTYDDAMQAEKRNSGRIRNSTTQLFSLLQNTARDLGLSLGDLQERRTPMKDSDLQEVSVDVNFKDISVDKLSSFLERVEGKRSDGVVKVQKLKVKTRFDNAEMLEASMTVTTWKPTNAGAATGAPGATDVEGEQP